MTPCLYVILATWAAAGPPEQTTVQVAPVEYVETGPVYAESPSSGLRARLRRFFGGTSGGSTYYPMAFGPVAQPSSSPYAPSRYTPPVTKPASDLVEQSEPVAPVEGEQIIEGTPTPAPTEADVLRQLKVAKKYQDRVGHEDDYSWITGHLFYVHSEGGHWVLRYTLPDQVDRYGGSVILAPGVEMRNYREGDLVCVYGKVLDEGRPFVGLGGALYRVDTITMVERADP
jgi:hypothetical protein